MRYCVEMGYTEIYLNIGHTKTGCTRKTRHTKRHMDKRTPYQNDHYILCLLWLFRIEKHICIP